MKLKCKNIATSQFNDILFTQNKVYEFVPVDNKYTKDKNYIGYINKDNEGLKRWVSKEFLEEYFEGVN